MPWLHPDSLSSDPWYGRPDPAELAAGDEAGFRIGRLAPWRALTRGLDGRLTPEPERDPHAPAAERSLAIDATQGCELVLDFGTELEATLELELSCAQSATVFVGFGESLPEAMGWGLPPSPANGFPAAKEQWDAPAGASRRAFAPRGFRFARLQVFDGGGSARLRAHAAARVLPGGRVGDLRCADASFQRVWQASAYTARLCARPRAYWDGIKRDRHGWYGDARITQATLDTVWRLPEPAEGMLLEWPERGWANGIPLYSFDAVAMFRQHLLAHGASREAVPAIYARMRAFLGWVLGSQVDDGLFVMRRDDVDYFFGIGFIDWSPQPLGGRFEELPWLQCGWAECLGQAADIAGWLGREDDVAAWRRARDLVAARIVRDLWRPGGFPHTLQRATAAEDWAMPLAAGLHHRLSYVEGKRFGPSRPSRQTAARAAAAGVLDAERARQTLTALDDVSIPPIVTPYYLFHEQQARAQCGDPAGALTRMAGYVGAMLAHDSATVWESYEPEVAGFRRWGLHGFPKSLCHGWGSGLVPLATRWLLGIEPIAPGFAEIRLHQPAPLPFAFDASVATPFGPIRVRRDGPDAPVQRTVPAGIRSRTGDA